MFGYLLDLLSTIKNFREALPVLGLLAKYWTVFGVMTIMESLANMLNLPYLIPGYPLLKFSTVIYLFSASYKQIFNNLFSTATMFGYLLDLLSTIKNFREALPVLGLLAKYWTVFGVMTIMESLANMLNLPYLIPGYPLLKFSTVIYLFSASYKQIFNNVNMVWSCITGMLELVRNSRLNEQEQRIELQRKENEKERLELERAVKIQLERKQQQLLREQQGEQLRSQIDQHDHKFESKMAVADTLLDKQYQKGIQMVAAAETSAISYIRNKGSKDKIKLHTVQQLHADQCEMANLKITSFIDQRKAKLIGQRIDAETRVEVVKRQIVNAQKANEHKRKMKEVEEVEQQFHKDLQQQQSQFNNIIYLPAANSGPRDQKKQMDK